VVERGSREERGKIISTKRRKMDIYGRENVGRNKQQRT
jgi:hypothetical protein